MPNLFRTQALEHRQRDWLGSIQLVRPVSLALLTAFVVVVAAAVAAYLVWGEYTRKARVSGYLVPDRGLIRLMAPQSATVVENHVAEGRAVHQGDVLFVLAIGQSTSSGDAQTAIQSSLASRERSLQDAVRQRGLLEQNQLASLELARKALARLESLRNDNFVSSAQVQTKTEEILGLKAQLQALERQRGTQLREIATLEAQRRELPLKAQAARGEIDRDLAAITQLSAENEARQRLVVRAPQDGVVTAVLADTGQAVTPGVALASLLPADARLQAHLFAPSSAVGFVRAHQAVQLRYQAFPYQKFGHQAGEVIQVARSPLQAAELAGLPLQGAAASGEPLYRITVALDQQTVAAYGQAQALSPGMQLEADVLLDRRRLIEWLFEPVLGIASRV